MSAPQTLTRADAERMLASSEVHARIGLALVEWVADAVALSFRPDAWTRSALRIHDRERLLEPATEAA